MISLRSNAVAVDANSGENLTVGRLAGETLLSGGGVFDGAAVASKYVQASFPAGASWAVFGRNNTNDATTLRAHALCLTGS